MRHEKGNFLSPTTITAQKIRHVILILVHFQNFSISTLLKNFWYLALSCSSAFAHLLQIILKMSQTPTNVKIFEPKPTTNTYGVKMLEV